VCSHGPWTTPFLAVTLERALLQDLPFAVPTYRRPAAGQSSLASGGQAGALTLDSNLSSLSLLSSPERKTPAALLAEQCLAAPPLQMFASARSTRPGSFIDRDDPDGLAAGGKSVVSPRSTPRCKPEGMPVTLTYVHGMQRAMEEDLRAFQRFRHDFQPSGDRIE
jgi:hypothetical protein